MVWWMVQNARLTKADVPEYSDGGCDVDHRSQMEFRVATQEIPRIPAPFVEDIEEAESLVKILILVLSRT